MRLPGSQFLTLMAGDLEKIRMMAGICAIAGVPLRMKAQALRDFQSLLRDFQGSLRDPGIPLRDFSRRMRVRSRTADGSPYVRIHIYECTHTMYQKFVI